MKQGNGPPSQDEGKPGLFLSCGGTFGVPLKWRRVCWGTSSVASRESRTLLRLKREGGISFVTPQWKRASSRVEGRISWFFSSCGSKHGVSLELRWRPQRPTRVASGKSSLHVSCEGPLRIPLQSVPRPRSELRPEPQGSSRVLIWTSGFLWSFNRGVRPCLV